jgi:hypothetical protein
MTRPPSDDRHERHAWLRWGIQIVVALLAAIIAAQCGVQVQIPPPPLGR